MPLGIAYATTYGVAKALTKYQKYISTREATECSDNQCIINAEIQNIKQQYELYAKNPHDENTKQDMIKALKNSNPCAVYQFLVEIFSSTGHLPQNFVEMLKNNGLTAYEMFAKIDKTRTSDMIDIINAIRTILTDPNNSELSMDLLNLWFSPDDRYNSITLLICYAFTNESLKIMRNCKGTSAKFKTLANDLIALRSFLSKTPEDELKTLKCDDYSPSQFADLLRQNHLKASPKCLNLFDPENRGYLVEDDGQCALQILIEQELMTRNKN